MTNDELLTFKKQLESMKASINADVERTLDTLTSQTGNIPDPNDRASMESDLSFELRIRERERKLSEKIDERSSGSAMVRMAFVQAVDRTSPPSAWRHGR